jgi:hypothetical protein
MKATLIIGGSAAAATYVTQKWGGPLEAQAVKLHIPPVLAHMAVVGGFTALSYWVATKVL